MSSQETPLFKVLSVETPVAGTAYEGFDFVKKCATEYSAKPKTEDHPKLVNWLIFQLEEEEIFELKKPESASYKTLQATIEPIMEQLRCNIVVVIGHNNECFNYIETSGIPILNTLPTIVLIVACFSDKKIAKYNTDPVMIEKNFFFFGFQNFMHLLHGEILACRNNHLAEPFLDCRFDEVADDLETIRTNVTQFNKPYAEQIDLLKCCRGRYEHFKQMFYDYLYNRECVKFPTEKLLAKLSVIRKPDGSLVRDVTMTNTGATMTDEQLRNYIFSRSDGEPCTKEGSCSTGKTIYNTYKANLTAFDDRVKFGSSATKEMFKILNGTNEYAEKSHAEKDAAILTLLKTVSKPQGLKTLTHSARYVNERGEPFIIPIFFFIFAENYKLSTQEILKSYDVDLSLLTNRNMTLVRCILEHMTRRYPPKTLTESEVYRLLKAIGAKDSNAITVALKTKPVQFMIFESQTCYLSLIELMFRYFPTAIPIYSEYIIAHISKLIDTKDWTIEQGSKVLELYLSSGKLNMVVGEKRVSGLDQYEYDMGFGGIYGVAKSTFKLHIEFVLLLYIYTQDDTVFPDYTLENRIAYWTTQLEKQKTYLKPKMKHMIEVYKEAKQFFDAGGVSIESYRKTPEQVNELMDYDLEPMEAKMGAITEVKTYFSKVQPNIQKRKNLNAATKDSAFQALLGFYKGVDASLNEGKNALARLRKMHDFYRNFLASHPRANKSLHTASALKGPPETSQLWTYQIFNAYKASLVVPKRKTVRRASVKIVNVNALRQELGNISSRLNAHNSGATRLHHMTVKSLRKKKNTLEQKIRNLAPVTAAGNNTEPENNQGGGRRRTRKVRR